MLSTSNQEAHVRAGLLTEPVPKTGALPLRYTPAHEDLIDDNGLSRALTRRGGAWARERAFAAHLNRLARRNETAHSLTLPRRDGGKDHRPLLLDDGDQGHSA